MLLVSNTLTYPLGTYHYCQDGVHVAISGFEKHLRVEKSHKKAWNEQELYETCYWSKQYFQESGIGSDLSGISTFCLSGSFTLKTS